MLEELLPWLPGFAAAYAIQAVSVASPGPGVALLLGMALSQGRASALAASLGIAVGAAGLALATTQGLGLLMERVAWLSTVIRFAGACYLFWLAIAAVGATQNAPIGVVAVFVAGAFALSLAGHAAYAVLLSSRPFRFAYEYARRWIEAGIGGCLAWFAFRLASDRS